MKRYIILFLSIFLIGINAFALDDIYIKDISVVEKSIDTITNSDDSIDLTFNNVGDTIRYKLNIVNNKDYDYVLNYKSNYDFIDIRFNKTKIKKNSTNEVLVDVTYNTLMSDRSNYNINDLIKIKLDNEYNKSVLVKGIWVIILLISIIVVCMLISKIDSSRILRVIIISILFIPIYSSAITDFLDLKIDIGINYNTLLPRCFHNYNNCLAWNKFNISNKNNIRLITKNNKSFSKTYNYNNTEYTLESKYDVSNHHNKQVVLGVYKTTNNEVLLVIGQNNGVILPNNSSYLFRNTSFKLYDLNSVYSHKVINMSHMFENVMTDSIDLSSINTDSVNNMSSMFYNSRINELNISNINTNNLINTNYMFANSRIDKLIGFKELQFSSVKYKFRVFYHSKINHIY